MEFTKEQLNKFKKSWEKESGKKISDEKARVLFEVVVKIMIPIYSDKL